MSELLPFSIEAGVPINSSHAKPDPDREAQECLERMRDEALQVTNRLEAIFAKLYRARHGTSLIALAPGPERIAGNRVTYLRGCMPPQRSAQPDHLCLA